MNNGLIVSLVFWPDQTKLLDAIDAWQAEHHPDSASRGETILRLTALALEAEAAKKGKKR